MAKDEISKLYNNEQSNEKDFHCDSGYSIFVRNNSVINSCAFRKIKWIEGRFNYVKKLFIFKNKSNIVLHQLKRYIFVLWQCTRHTRVST